VSAALLAVTSQVPAEVGVSVVPLMLQVPVPPVIA
jgi:hypothetical protein